MIYRAWFFQTFFKITGFPIDKICIKPQYCFEDKNVQDRKIHGKAIIVSNHLNFFDYAALIFAFPSRVLHCVIAEITFGKNFLMTAFLSLMGSIKVDRFGHDFNFLGKCSKILDHNGVVVMYPESRIPDKKKGDVPPLEFKPSVVYMALQANAPIIPYYSNGQVFSKEKYKAIIGKPIDVRAYYDSTFDEKTNLKNIANILRNKIIELRDELENQSKK